MLFFVTLHSDGSIFPFLLCLPLLFFSLLFVRSLHTTIFAFIFLRDGFDHCLLYIILYIEKSKDVTRKLLVLISEFGKVAG